MDFFTLGDRSLVIPEDGRSEYVAILIMKYEPMHLAGKGDRLDCLGVIESLDETTDCIGRGFPPGIRVLLRPPRMQAAAWPRLLLSSQDCTCCGFHKQGADSACAYIDAENMDGGGHITIIEEAAMPVEWGPGL
jgi:hypothetical protein